MKSLVNTFTWAVKNPGKAVRLGATAAFLLVASALPSAAECIFWGKTASNQTVTGQTGGYSLSSALRNCRRDFKSWASRNKVKRGRLRINCGSRGGGMKTGGYIRNFRFQIGGGPCS